MNITLSGNELAAFEHQEDCRNFILAAFVAKEDYAKDVFEASEKPFQVYAYRYDAGMTGTNGIRFIVSNDGEESILDSLWDELGEHVEQYSYLWHVDYESESDDEDSDPYQDALDEHKENASHFLELYDPKKHHGKIPGGSNSVEFELFY